jgi:hypothetical protein
MAVNSVPMSNVRRASLSVGSMRQRTRAYSNIICKQYNTQAAAKVIVLLSYGERRSTAFVNFGSCIMKLLLICPKHSEA